ncbi:MAG: Ig-like domain-containing protein, partial [Desulforhopalus sp.]|nr:Ig-like domain-containing protein [Desulforhopalus sp.]
DVEYLAEGQTKVETFTFDVVDSKGDTVERTVSVTITGTGDAPIAVADTNMTTENADVIGNVLMNDTDLDTTDTHTVSAVNGAAGDVGTGVTGSNGGTFNIATDGSYTFDPGSAFDDLAAGETRTTTIDYTNLDSNGGSDTATLTVTVTGTNDAPVITTVSHHTVAENTTLVTSLTSTDVDADGIPGTFSISGGPDAALFHIVDGNLEFISAPDYETDAHSYRVEITVTDGLNSTTRILIINLRDVNDVLPTIALSQSLTAKRTEDITTDWYVYNETSYLYGKPSMEVVNVNEAESFYVPSWMFWHSDTNARMRLEASLVGGSSLPSWLFFDSSRGKFQGVPPLGSDGVMDIQIAAYYQDGNVVYAQLTLHILPPPVDDSAMSLESCGLYLADSVMSREVIINEPAVFDLPAGLFKHCDADTRIALKATLADGSPLPEWITFDASTGRFVVIALEGVSENLDIKIIATDQNGNESEAHFLLLVKDVGDVDTANKAIESEKQAPVVSDNVVSMMMGRASFSEQLASQSRKM